jgi:hypothetical protein
MPQQIAVSLYPLGLPTVVGLWRVTVRGGRLIGGAERQPSDDELLQGLRELMAEDEHDLGFIPEDARAEVERQWRD